MSQIISLDKNFAVAGQLSASAMQSAATKGFHAIICNRPDNEEVDQPTHDTMAKAATRAGMAFHAIPFSMHSLDRHVIDAFETAADSAKGPILAYCRSGTRCTIAWCAYRLRKGDALDAILQTAYEAGYDLRMQSALITHLA